MMVSQISRTRRATQGVRLINLRGNQKVSTLAVVPKDDEDEEYTDIESDTLDTEETIIQE